MGWGIVDLKVNEVCQIGNIKNCAKLNHHDLSHIPI